MLRAFATSTMNEATRLVQELRRRLEAMDVGSISDPEGWWSLILEQAEDGLL
jgi:hypothetical protein